MWSLIEVETCKKQSQIFKVKIGEKTFKNICTVYSIGLRSVSDTADLNSAVSTTLGILTLQCQ